jgi:hydrogenase maturation protease
MKRVLIAGIGNVLLGDDGVGPYIVRWLEATHTFGEGIVLADLGTPALDFIDHICGLDALIVIDSVDNGLAPGSITLYRKEDFSRLRPSVRMDTHSPAITESLIAAEIFFGISPKEVLLIGITAQSFAAGCELSDAMKSAVAPAVRAVLSELDRLGMTHQPKLVADTVIWWTENPQLQSR